MTIASNSERCSIPAQKIETDDIDYFNLENVCAGALLGRARDGEQGARTACARMVTKMSAETGTLVSCRGCLQLFRVDLVTFASEVHKDST